LSIIVMGVRPEASPVVVQKIFSYIGRKKNLSRNNEFKIIMFANIFRWCCRSITVVSWYMIYKAIIMM
jgi:hypothetical protein